MEVMIGLGLGPNHHNLVRIVFIPFKHVFFSLIIFSQSEKLSYLGFVGAQLASNVVLTISLPQWYLGVILLRCSELCA